MASVLRDLTVMATHEHLCLERTLAGTWFPGLTFPCGGTLPKVTLPASFSHQAHSSSVAKPFV